MGRAVCLTQESTADLALNVPIFLLSIGGRLQPSSRRVSSIAMDVGGRIGIVALPKLVWHSFSRSLLKAVIGFFILSSKSVHVFVGSIW